jgi:hypothetical protein
MTLGLDSLLTGLTSDPSSPSDGELWYRTDTDRLWRRTDGITERVVPMDWDSFESTANFSTSSTTPQDCFGGSVVTANYDGDYMALFEAVTAGSRELDLAIFEGATSVQNVRLIKPGCCGIIWIPIVGVSAGDTFHATMNKSTGAGGGNAQVSNRRLTIWRVN